MIEKTIRITLSSNIFITLDYYLVQVIMHNGGRPLDRHEIIKSILLYPTNQLISRIIDKAKVAIYSYTSPSYSSSLGVIIQNPLKDT